MVRLSATAADEGAGRQTPRSQVVTGAASVHSGGLDRDGFGRAWFRTGGWQLMQLGPSRQVSDSWGGIERSEGKGEERKRPCWKGPRRS